MADAATRSGGAVPASALARLTQLLRGPAPGEAASAADFDVAEFIGEALESLSLEQLRSFLHGRLDATRAELVAAINSDYTQFVSLSSQLEGLEATLMRLKRPLTEAGERLQDVAGALAARRREVASSQRSAEALAARSAALQAYLSGRELLGAAGGSVDRLEAAAGDAGAGAALPAHALHRAALQLGRAREHLADAAARAASVGGAASPTGSSSSSGSKASGPGRGGDHTAAADPALAQLADSVAASLAEAARVEEGLTPLLVAALRARLARLGKGAPTQPQLRRGGGSNQPNDDDEEAGGDSDGNDLHLLLSALGGLLGREAEAHDAITSAVTRPLLAGLFTQARVDDGARGSFKGFSRACDEALAAVTDEGGPLRAVLEAARNVPRLDVLSSCVWAPLTAVLAAQLPSWATPVQPALFQANYTALSTLFVRLRVFASGFTLLLLPAAAAVPAGSSPPPQRPQLEAVPASEALQACPAAAALRASLAPKLQVYHALRVSDVTGRLDKAAAARVALDLGLGTAAAGPGAATPLPSPGAASGGAPLPGGVAQQGAAPQPQTGPAAVVQASEALAGIPAAYLPPASALQPAVPLLLPASAALWSSLSFLWSPSVLVPALGAPVLTASVACVGRYGGWSLAGAVAGAGRHGVPSVVAAANGLAKQQQQPTHSGDGSGGDDLPRLPPSWTAAMALPLPVPSPPAAAGSVPVAPAAAVPGPGGGPATASSSTTWPLAGAGPDAASWVPAPSADAGTSLDSHLAAAADAGALASLIDAALTPRVLASLALPPVADAGATNSSAPSSSSSTSSTAVAALLASASASLRALRGWHLAVARAVLARSCAAPLSSLRAVPATFRMTNKAAPSKPSPYVATVLKPLRALVGAAAATAVSGSGEGGGKGGGKQAAGGAAPAPLLLAGLPAEHLCALAAGVAGDVGVCLDGTLGGVLSSLARMEESLAWLKKAPAGVAGGGGASAATASDSDKIGLQLLLDVRALARDADELLARGLPPPGSPARTGALPGFVAAAGRVAPYEHLAPATAALH